MANVSSDRLCPVRLEQLVNISGVDLDHDQRFIKRDGISQRLEHRTVKADDRKPIGPLPAKGLERKSFVALKRLQAGLKVGRSVLETHEAEHRQCVGQSLLVTLHAIDERAHAARVSQDQRQHGGVARGDLLLGGRQAGDFRDQYLTVSVISALQPEVLPPVQKHIGCRVAAQQVAQPPKLVGMFLIKKDRLDIQPVEEFEPAEPVGLLDCDRVSAEAFGHSGNQVALFCACRLVFRSKQ